MATDRGRDTTPPTRSTDDVTYQFDMNREEWREWTEAVPRRDALHDRLRELIRTDSVMLSNGVDVTDERRQSIGVNGILFSLDGKTVSKWRGSIAPDHLTGRDEQLAGRLKDLIHIDTALAVEEFDVAKLRLVDLKSERVLEKARQGQNAIEKREKPHQAVEKLRDIEEIADSLSIGLDAE